MRTNYTELRVMQDEYAQSRVSERLREAIRAQGLSLKAFAELLNMPYRSLQDYVSGKSKPGFEQLQKFAMAGIDVGYLLTGRSTEHQLFKISSHLEESPFLAADPDLLQLILNELPGVVDRALEEVPDDRFLGAVSWPTIALYENAAIIAAEVASQMSSSLTDLRAQGVSAHSAVQAIVEATTLNLLAKVRSGLVP